MKVSMPALLVGLTLAGAARAQSPAQPAAAPTRGYAEGVAQSAFGNVTSQSYGGEIGVALRPGFVVFVDAGRVLDTAPDTLRTNAKAVAGGIATVAGSADYTAKQPVTFGIAGLKFVVPVTGSRVEPYVMAGFGAAQVKRDVTFTTSAGDAAQFVTLGGDLSGTETKPMLSIGGGVGVPVWGALMIDLQYRYGRVFTSDTGLNINRAGVGIGVRF